MIFTKKDLIYFIILFFLVIYVNHKSEKMSNNNVEALTGEKGSGYRGYQNKTKSGKTCMNWNSQSPHEHVVTNERYPNKGIGNHNFCRNPDNENTIWCYTTDKDTRWEYCEPLEESKITLTNQETNNSELKNLIEREVQKKYNFDLEAIRNLSKYANQLTKDGKLVVPGGLEIQGKLKMKGLELYPDGDNRLVIKNSNGQGVLGSRNKYYFHITSGKEFYFDKQLNIPKGINMDGKLSLTKDGNNCLLVKNSNGQAALGSKNKYYFHIESGKDFYLNNNLTAAGNITGKKDIKAEGNGYFGPAYIGKYGKTRDDYAQFSHVKQTGTSNYAITQHHGGSSMFNAPSGKSASIRLGDSVKLNVTGDVDIKENLNVNDKITSKNLEVKSWADFGTSSNRKMRVEPTSNSNHTTYLSFYEGSERVNFILPKTNGQLVDGKWKTFAR